MNSMSIPGQMLLPARHPLAQVRPHIPFLLLLLRQGFAVTIDGTAVTMDDKVASM